MKLKSDNSSEEEIRSSTEWVQGQISGQTHVIRKFVNIDYTMQKKRFTSRFIAILLVLITSGSFAQSRVVRVGAWNNFPVLFQDEDGTVQGFYVDLLTEIGKKENIRFEYVLDTWEACLENIRTGKIDLLPGTGYTEERAAYADFGKSPLLTVWGELYAPKTAEINGILDISGKTIGVVKSDILTRNFKELAAKFDLSCQLVEFGVYEDVFKAVASGKVNAGIAEVTYGWLKKDEFRLKATGVAFNPTNYFFISPKGKNPDLLQTLDQYLVKWKQQEFSYLDQSKEKWLRGMVSTVTKLPKWLVNALAGLASIIVIALIFILLLKLKVERATREILQGEELLRESNRYLQAVLDSSNDAVFVHEAQTGQIIDVNQSMCAMYGYSHSEALQSPIVGLSQGETPYSEVEVNEWLRKAREIGPQTFEWMAKHKDGHLFWTEVSIRYAIIGEKQLFVVVVRNITRRKQVELELIQAKEHAEESDRLKTAFLQNMSHEIRTPMNAIMGFSELLVENYGNKPNLEKFSNIILQRSSDLLDIINDILDISKIESGQLTLHNGECNLIELFAELHTFFSEQQVRMGKSHIHFSIQFQDDPAYSRIQTDKVKLKQILINLIGNAFKFTDHGSIECGCKRENDQLLFYITDTGIGIPADKHDTVFERFSQLHHASEKVIGGTGLGLSIAKGLIGLLGGKIELESEPEKGTTVNFSIQYLKSDSIPDKPIEYKENLASNLANKTILLVEDDIYNLEYLKEILTSTGFTIISCQNGKDAVQLANSHPVDLILMDIRLPDMNGYAATSLIKRSNPHVKVIAQTAFAAQEERQKALDAGCIDYISKPTKRDFLLALLNRHLSANT